MLVNVCERARSIETDRTGSRSPSILDRSIKSFILFFCFSLFFLSSICILFLYIYIFIFSFFLSFFLAFFLPLFRFSSQFFLSRNLDDHACRRRASRRMNRLRFRRTIVGRGRFERIEREIQTFVD